MSTAYELALKDPRWQARRAHVLHTHKHKCDRCNAKRTAGAVLDVHHKHYVHHRQPWDYAMSDYGVLCRNCHDREHRTQRTAHYIQDGRQLMLFDPSELDALMVRP